MVELCRWKDSWKQPPGLRSHGVTSVKGVDGIPGLLDTMGYHMSSGFLLKSHLSIVRTLYHSQHQLGCQPHTQPVALPEASQVRGLPCLELKPVRLALQYIYIYIYIYTIYTISMYIYIYTTQKSSNHPPGITCVKHLPTSSSFNSTSS